jgi:molecular chaperone GrpE
VTEKQDVTPAAKAPAGAGAGGERIVIRDKRKLRPDTLADVSAEAAPVDGELVEAGEAHDVPVEVHEEAVNEPAEVGELRSTLDERTADLQRVTAEYANYRKRVERDRTVAAEQAVGMVLASLLPVLDDIDRARDHGDLTGPFASVAEQLNTVMTKFGLTAFGVKGDAFDPKVHEAVAHLTSPEVTEPTCIDVMRRGYLLGERLLRPAMVAVADPAEPSEQSAPAEVAPAEDATPESTEDKTE